MNVQFYRPDFPHPVYVDHRLLCLGRFLVGLGIGISAVVVPVYLGEVAPAQVMTEPPSTVSTEHRHGIDLQTNKVCNRNLL